MAPPASEIKERNSRLLREDIAHRSVVYRAMPEVIGLHTTEICNLRCIQCPRGVKQGRRQLPREHLRRIAADLFPAARKAVVTAAAGEPLLGDFDLVLEQALRHKVKLDVITNGTLLSADLYRQAQPALDHLNVSLDAHEPDLYRRIRGGDLERVLGPLRAIRDIRAARPDDVLITISALVLRSNLTALPDFVRWAASLDVDGVILQRLQHQVRNSRDEDPFLSPGAGAVGAVIERARRAAVESGVNLFLGEFGQQNVVVRPVRDKRPPPLEGRGLCWFLAQEFAVMYTGDVYPCCFVTDHCFGNVLREEPMAIWNSRVARRLRAAHYSGRGTLFCRGCLHAPHLPAPPASRLADLLRLSRRAVCHVRSRLRRMPAAPGGSDPAA
ncbi:MAG: radical SAM protein [Planctomycetes bacterium]|nr:radical SAM protein [Planctomycetota bacterium]